MAHSFTALAAGEGVAAIELLISRGGDLERESDGRDEREEDRKGLGDRGMEDRKGFCRRLDRGRAIGDGARKGTKKAKLGFMGYKERELGLFCFIVREGKVDGEGWRLRVVRQRAIIAEGQRRWCFPWA